MENNIFFKNNISTNTSNEKFNPDIIDKYNTIKNRKNVKNEFVNEYYKTVTNQPIKTKIKNVSELKLECDIPNPQKMEIDYQNVLYQRSIEHEIVQKSKNDYIKKNNIRIKDIQQEDMEYQQRINIKIPNNIDSIDEYVKLKKNYERYSIKENDKLSKHKERFNNILDDFNNILL